MKSTTSQQQLEQMVNQVFGLTAQKIAEQSKNILAGEKEAIQVDLANKQQTIQKLVKDLQDEMRERSEEHTSELQSPDHLVCRLLLEKKKTAILLFGTGNLTLVLPVVKGIGVRHMKRRV